jgi:hypothetical protein
MPALREKARKKKKQGGKRDVFEKRSSFFQLWQPLNNFNKFVSS